MLFGLKMNEDDVCLANYATTHTILRDKRYFLELTLIKANVSTISGTINLVEGFGRANITLPNGTRFHINDALYSSKSIRNLLSFKKICRNGYHIENMIFRKRLEVATYFLFYFFKGKQNKKENSKCDSLFGKYGM